MHSYELQRATARERRALAKDLKAGGQIAPILQLQAAGCKVDGILAAGCGLLGCKVDGILAAGCGLRLRAAGFSDARLMTCGSPKLQVSRSPRGGRAGDGGLFFSLIRWAS